MKRIVICCDGTWRRLDEADLTNAAQLALAIPPKDAHGTPQLVMHLDGVGSGRAGSGLGRLLDRTLGGAFGAGLDGSVVDAYRFLVFNYEPGDQIYLFGFSRGAFTARSLGGMIRKCGILSRRHAQKIAAALALYRDRDPEYGPTCAPSLRFRANYAPEVALGAKEIGWRRAHVPDRDHSRVHDLKIRYIGVWDTVGALGVPGYVVASPLVNRRHQFHDTELSSHVVAARHAVAVDERRPSFAPALWTNLERLNGAAAGPAAPYQQRWFPGVHGAVGGGGRRRELSSLALLWVLEGAERAEGGPGRGLEVDPAERARLVAEADPLGPLVPHHETSSPMSWLRALTASDRKGPLEAEADALSDALGARWRGEPGYRPATMRRVGALLDALGAGP